MGMGAFAYAALGSQHQAQGFAAGLLGAAVCALTLAALGFRGAGVHVPRSVTGVFVAALVGALPSMGLQPAQALAAYLQPLGISLDAEAFRLSLPRQALDEAAARLPAGQGPALLLAPSGGAGDWPAGQWRALPELLRSRLPDLRVVQAQRGGSLIERAAQLAGCDVVLSSDPVTTDLALLNGSPLVVLDRPAAALPQRQGVQAVGEPSQLEQLQPAAVLQALGLA